MITRCPSIWLLILIWSLWCLSIFYGLAIATYITNTNPSISESWVPLSITSEIFQTEPLSVSHSHRERLAKIAYFVPTDVLCERTKIHIKFLHSQTQWRKRQIIQHSCQCQSLKVYPCKYCKCCYHIYDFSPKLTTDVQ